ncbi:NAD(P)H-dependent flavin oxidoreductase [Kitasatospora camelliae]|uniref:Probable nitronate monooxygenase n=1 Tax=Kitasatospora camelliae TaxID=3156397 RepID=A0AAU8JRI6_9ACTN
MTASSTAGRFGNLLGLDHPVVQGPFGGGMSSVALAAAVSEAGGLGSFGAHHLSPDALDALVGELRAATSRAFAVNLWVPLPGEVGPLPSADDLAEHLERLAPYYAELGVPKPDPVAALAARPVFEEQLEALIAAGPPAISFVMGCPPAAAVAEAKRRGIVLIGTATTVAEAEVLAEAGLDAVVASGSDAGGHRGAFLRPVRESLVGTFALVPQVADAVTVPVIAAGGIADGRGVVAALVLGADAVQIGTGFLATEESAASEVHRAALLGPDARTTVLTRLFSGRTARGILNRFTREQAAAEELVPPYPVQNVLMQPIRAAAARSGEPGLTNLWSGQAAPLVTGGGARAYLDNLLTDAELLLGRRL